MRTHIITAICTPLTDDESLHLDGLTAHLEDQWRHGIGGVLIAGSMGAMQLLDDATYRDLVRHAAQLAHGRGEVLVGVGDTSFKRTLQRIQYAEQFDIDGVVVLAPFFWTLGQADLIAYFRGLADQSRKPLYIYDLPGVTKTPLHLDTVLELSKHPNIHGIKSSIDWVATRRLMDHVGDGFRVVPAQADAVDMLVRLGVPSNLDGIFGVFPDLTASIVEAAENGDYALAASRQSTLTEVRQLMLTVYTLWPACTAILNARGVPGKFYMTPAKPFDPAKADQFFNEPLVRAALGKFSKSAS